MAGRVGHSPPRRGGGCGGGNARAQRYRQVGSARSSSKNITEHNTTQHNTTQNTNIQTCGSETNVSPPTKHPVLLNDLVVSLLLLLHHHPLSSSTPPFPPTTHTSAGAFKLDPRFTDLRRPIRASVAEGFLLNTTD